MGLIIFVGVQGSSSQLHKNELHSLKSKFGDNIQNAYHDESSMNSRMNATKLLMQYNEEIVTKRVPWLLGGEYLFLNINAIVYCAQLKLLKARSLSDSDQEVLVAQKLYYLYCAHALDDIMRCICGTSGEFIEAHCEAYKQRVVALIPCFPDESVEAYRARLSGWGLIPSWVTSEINIPKSSGENGEDFQLKDRALLNLLPWDEGVSLSDYLTTLVECGLSRFQAYSAVLKLFPDRVDLQDKDVKGFIKERFTRFNREYQSQHNPENLNTISAYEYSKKINNLLPRLHKESFGDYENRLGTYATGCYFDPINSVLSHRFACLKLLHELWHFITILASKDRCSTIFIRDLNYRENFSLNELYKTGGKNESQ